jgi:crotonobetainyl-CoA:carnitine CoA-transferase CaiB-like acyl-CoA transferase
MGNAHPSIAPYELLHTAEGELVLAVGNDRQFRALTVALDCAELADDERFSTNSARVDNRAQLRSELESRLRKDSATQWALELSAVRVPAGSVNDIAGAFALAQALGLEPIVAVPAADGQLSQLTRNPIRMSATPPSYRSAAPAMPLRRGRPI